MNLQLLVCLGCGAPLGRVETIPAIVECEFCDAVISVGQGAPVITGTSTLDAKRTADTRAARMAFIAAVDELAKAKRDPFEALCEAAAKHLGTAGQTEALARIVFAIAVDFETETRTSIRSNGLVLNRIAEGYLNQLDDLRASGTVELNLPFLVADERGPKHLARVLTPAILTELAQRDPRAASGTSTGAGGSTNDLGTKKKKGWWPF